MIVRKPSSLAAAILVLIVAVAFLAIGLLRTFKVYDAKADDFGVQVFTRVPEQKMVYIATYSGVERQKDKLVSTEDPNAPTTGGKKACPT